MIFDPVVFPYPSEDKVECRVTNEFLLTREQHEELMKKIDGTWDKQTIIITITGEDMEDGKDEKKGNR